MRVIALNGWGYSIAHWLPGVECPSDCRWSSRKARDLAHSLTGPTILIGFSRGASAAITAAQHSPHVQHVYAHSPSFRNWSRRRLFGLTLYRTVGDRTPTYEGTEKTRQLYQQLGYEPKMYNLAPEPWTPKTWIEMKMEQLGHQFHNGVQWITRDLYDITVSMAAN